MLLTFIQLGLIIVLFALFMTVTVAFLLKIIVKSAPQDIQQVISKRPPQPMWKTVTGAVLALLLIAGFAAVLFWAGYDAVSKNMSFWQIFARSEIILIGYKLFDMFVFDILIISKGRLFERLFPETKDCASIKNFGFNLKSQTAKLFVFTGISLAAAALLSSL